MSALSKHLSSSPPPTSTLPPDIASMHHHHQQYTQNNPLLHPSRRQQLQAAHSHRSQSPGHDKYLHRSAAGGVNSWPRSRITQLKASLYLRPKLISKMLAKVKAQGETKPRRHLMYDLRAFKEPKAPLRKLEASLRGSCASFLVC